MKGFSTPEVNDIIVFTKPGTDEVFIKRCLATPGDTLEIRKGIVYINGDPNQETPDIINGKGNTPGWKVYPGGEDLSWDIDNWGPVIIPYKGMQLTAGESSVIFYRKLLNDREGVLLSGDEGDEINNGNQYRFNNDYYFMAGDNRHNSRDSRFFGPVPEQDIIGRVTLFIFSKKREGGRYHLSISDRGYMGVGPSSAPLLKETRTPPLFCRE